MITKTLKFCDTSDYIMDPLPKFATQRLDHQIAITTNSGILILLIHPAMDSVISSINYHKLFIKPSTYILINDLEIDTSKFIFGLSQEKVYECLLQNNIMGTTPNIAKTTFLMTQCRLSPKRLVDEENVIATITDTGTVEIHLKMSYLNGIVKYIPIINVTKLHIDKFKHKWKDIKGLSAQELYEETTRRVQVHTAKVMTWTHLIKTTTKNTEILPFAVLIVACADGRITFWQFNQIAMENHKDAKMMLIDEYETNMDITTMYWHPAKGGHAGMLIIGARNGQLQALPILNLIMNHFETDSLINLSDATDISVDYIETEVKNSHLIVHAVCQSYLKMHVINKGGKLLESKYYDTGNLIITGLEKTIQDTILLTTVTGTIKEVQTSVNGGKLRVQVRDIHVDIKWSKHALVGFFLSKNNALITFVTQDNGMIYKPPFKMYLMNYSIDSERAYHTFMSEDTLIGECYDLLEVMRVTSLHNKELICNNISPYTQYDGLPVSHLKKLRCIAKISEAVFDQVESITHYNIKQACDIELMIRIKFSVYLLQGFVKELQETESLSEFKRQVAHIAFTFLTDVVLQGFLNEHNLRVNYVDEILEVLQACREHNLREDLLCKICEMPLLGLSCPSGHLDNRCAISMVQIVRSKYKCPFCVVYVAEEARELHVQKVLLCPLCDNTLETVFGTTDKYEQHEFCKEDCLSNIP